MFQSEAAECGIACLGTIARHHGHESDLATLRRRFGVSIKGATLSQLMKIAGELQMGARPLKLDMEHLPALQLPCILHWDFNHFVVLQKVGNGRATIHDPAVGRRVLPLEELGKHFTGVALELRPAPGFQKVAVSQSLPVSSLWKGLSRTKRTLAQIFALSLVLQLFALLAPLFLQLTVDQVLPSAERNLLVVLGLGFLLLVLIQTATEALRGWILVQLGAAVNLQMQANLFHHLLRLPLTFFERRHLGDIVSRFGSLDAVQRALTNSFIEALVDGVMIVVALILMLLYSPLLTGICVFTVLLYALGRWALFAPLRSASYEELQRAARLQSHFLESIRGVQVLKLFNRTADRESAWQNLFVHRLNAQIQVARLGVGFMAYSHLLQGFLNVLVIWLGARAVIAGDFSLGMLTAFLAYKGQFVEKAIAFIEKGIEFRMLGLHAERIGDIAMEEPEPLLTSPTDCGALKGGLSARNLGYRYAPMEPLVFSGFNLEVAPGECVVLAGPSGCGKTTLLKVLLGLLPASDGEVLAEGRRLVDLGNLWLDQVGVVMQEDSLFAGSIAENIAFGETSPDTPRVVLAAQLAAVHEDVLKLPMQYNTLVGDMGSSLSGGQKQRVLLARALYRQPRILFLDEASSHLDVGAEQRINANLKGLGVTRIVVAHRPETIASGDRVVWVNPQLG